MSAVFALPPVSVNTTPATFANAATKIGGSDSHSASFGSELKSQIHNQSETPSEPATDKLTVVKPTVKEAAPAETTTTTSDSTTALTPPSQDLMAMMLAMHNQANPAPQTPVPAELAPAAIAIESNALGVAEANGLGTLGQAGSETMIPDLSAANANNQMPNVTVTPGVDPSLSAPSPSATIVPNTSPTTQASATYNIAPPVGNSGWDEAVNQRIVWMTSQNIQSATLNISPEHLGPIQVQIQMENQQANVQFFSAQVEVRQALQNAMPQLNQLFSQNGIQLGQTDVSSQNFGSNAQQQPQPSKPKSSNNELLSLDSLNTSIYGASPLSKGTGLLNIYA